MQNRFRSKAGTFSAVNRVEQAFPPVETSHRGSAMEDSRSLLLMKMQMLPSLLKLVSLASILFIPTYVFANHAFATTFLRASKANAPAGSTWGTNNFSLDTRPSQIESILDRYINAMTNTTEYADSDFSFTVDVQKAIYSHQHPRSCSDSSFLIFYV